MEVQSYVDHHVAKATLQQPKAYLAIMASHRGRAFRPWVGDATPPHPYKPLGL